MIKLLYTSCCSACFEWDNNLSYYNDKKYTVTLNGAEVFEGETNVFSLFNLLPNTRYTLGIVGSSQILEFCTQSESCCVVVTDCGAVGDGVHDDTDAIQNAINSLPQNGRIKIPAGVYSVAPLTLKSDMTLELEKDAVLLGSVDESKYPVIPAEATDPVTGEKYVRGTWEGAARDMHQALIFAERAQNISIVGQGTIDGNAQNSQWWVNVNLRKIGRPRLCFFNRCNNVVFHGITGQNSASWQFHPYFSQNVSFYNIRVNAPKNSPNTDGMDPEACDTVNIIGCHFSVGDDCVAIKSSKIAIANRYKQPAIHHTVRNCLMQNGHGAITLGSEMSGGVQDLTVNRCLFVNTDRGLRIKSRRGRGQYAVIDGIVFDNIKMQGVLTPMVINMFYFCCDPDKFSEYVWSRQKLPIDDRTPHLGKFCFKNMVCENCHVAASYFDGLPERPIDEITLENIKFTFAENALSDYPSMASFVKPTSKLGVYANNVGVLNIKNVSFDGVIGDEIVAQNIGQLNKV